MAMVDLPATMQRLLDRAEVAVGAANVNRKYISTGVPPHDDCGQLTVHLDVLTQVQLDPRGVDQGPRATNRYAQIPKATLVLTWISCHQALTSDGSTPSAATLQADALASITEMWSIYKALVGELADGTLFTSALKLDKSNVRIGDLTPLEPEGNLGGYELRIHISFA